MNQVPVLTNRKFRAKKDAAGKADGYILMALLLFVTFLIIASAAIAPSIAMQVKRDREEEMIHRGVQYSRGIKRFYKKFGRFPTRLEELENTNNIRFLRRRYKDPITGKDFRLLHIGEVQMFAQGVPGLATPGAPLPGGVTAVPGAIGSPGTPGGPPTGTSGFGAQSTFGASNPNGQNQVGQNQDVQNQNVQNQDIQNQDASGSNLGNRSNAATPSAVGSGSQPPRTFGETSVPHADPIFGGGPIVGVASVSHSQSIREFNKKNHYNDWQFVFDPTMDRGGLLTGPAQPPLMGAVPGGNASAVPGAQGINGVGTPGAGAPMTNSPQSPPGMQPQTQPQQQ